MRGPRQDEQKGGRLHATKEQKTKQKAVDGPGKRESICRNGKYGGRITGGNGEEATEDAIMLKGRVGRRRRGT